MKNRVNIASALIGLLLLAFVLPVSAKAGGMDSPGARVARIAARIAPAMGVTPRIVVRPNTSKSAFVLPDGTITVSNELLSTTESDDEIAFIVAHELSHILARDQIRWPGPGLTGDSDMGNLQLAEIRADANAVKFMEKAGYSPAASISILKRLSSEGANLKPRIAAISNLLGILN